MSWISAGPKTNPLANTVLADTGPLPGTLDYGYQLWISSTVAAVAVLEHLDAAGTTVVESHIFPVVGNQVLEVEFFVRLLDQESVRLRLNGLIVGSCQATLIQTV